MDFEKIYEAKSTSLVPYDVDKDIEKMEKRASRMSYVTAELDKKVPNARNYIELSSLLKKAARAISGGYMFVSIPTVETLEALLRKHCYKSALSAEEAAAWFIERYTKENPLEIEPPKNKLFKKVKPAQQEAYSGFMNTYFDLTEVIKKIYAVYDSKEFDKKLKK